MVLLALTSCTEWHAASVTPEQLGHGHYEEVRVHRSDGSSIKLGSPKLRGDSIVGRSSWHRRAVAVADITAIDEHRINALKTAGVVAAILATPVAVILVACAVSDCSINMSN